MKQRPDFLPFSRDHVAVHVEVSIPWTDERLCYDHSFDGPGLREEFGPLPELIDHIDFYRRKEIMEKRARSVDMLAHTIARSILDALGRDRRPHEERHHE